MHTGRGGVWPTWQAVVRMGILIGVLIGLLIGVAASARYLRQEIAANVGPRLRHIELQLDILRAELNLANEARLATLRKRIERGNSED
jgi:hypothetical protein